MNYKTGISTKPRPFLVAFSFAFIALFLGGCWNEAFVWSPDGSRATVISADGLYLCDAQGALSSLLVPNAYAAAWLGDSKRIVLARTRPIKDFAEIAAKLGIEGTRRIVAMAEHAWIELEKDSDKSDHFLESESFVDRVGAYFYLAEHYGEPFRKKMGEMKDLELSWHSLTIATVTGKTIDLGAAPFHEGLVPIQSIRPAPSGSAVAFVTGFPPGRAVASVKDLELMLVSTTPSAPATSVARHTAAQPDWAPDGQTLVYFKAADDVTTKSGDLALGTLVERVALDAEGHVQLAENDRSLASLIFQSTNTVRCLGDGRVIFDALEIQFPVAKDLDGREQLFAVDRTKEALALTPLVPTDQLKRLPKALGFFSVSPDQTQILFGGDAGNVWLFTLASNALELFTSGFEESRNLPLPAWRAPGQFVYAKNAGTIKKSALQLVLQKSKEETIWSHTWPAEVLSKLISKDPEPDPQPTSKATIKQ